MKQIFLAPQGADAGDGTRARPVATFARAAQLLADEAGDVEAVFTAGRYELSESIRIGPELARPGRTLTLCGEGEAVLSGGVRVRSWEPCTVNGHLVYRARLPQCESVRTFTVNGRRRFAASKFRDDPRAFGWLSPDLMNLEIRFSDLGEIRRPKQLEVVWIAEWKTFIYRAESVRGNVLTMQDSFAEVAGIVKLSMQTGHDLNGYWWPCAGRHRVYLQNDVSFLEERGTFCFDEEERLLYYYPEMTEDLAACECVAARLDEILTVTGDAAAGAKAENVVVRGLTMADGAFARIARRGIGINQAQSVYDGPPGLNSETGRIDIPYDQYDATINVNYARRVRFEDCVVKNTTKGGVYFHDGVEDSAVVGCVFSSIGDTAILVGDGMHGYIGDFGIDRNICLENNLIRGTSQIIFSAPGIQAYFVKGLPVRHNDVWDVGYGGICVGWG